MIRIRRLAEPPVLLQHQEQWRAKYLAERTASPTKRPSSKQYAHPDIVDALAAMSFHKCFYCEQSTKDSGAEVDHHVEVAEAPERAFDWENLYLSCPDCNRRKRPHSDVPVSACLDPCHPSVDPADHLSFDDEYICSRDGSTLGRETIRKYRLDRPDLDHKRVRQLRRFDGALLALQKRQIAEGRKTLREEEMEILRRFCQPEHPFSLMFQVHTARLGP